MRRFYLEYHDRVVQIAQMPSGQLQGPLRGSSLELSFNITQTPSAQLAAAFLPKKRLMEWAETVLQSEPGRRRP